jgi:hypothetical protein
MKDTLLLLHSRSDNSHYETLILSIAKRVSQSQLKHHAIARKRHKTASGGISKAVNAYQPT